MRSSYLALLLSVVGVLGQQDQQQQQCCCVPASEECSSTNDDYDDFLGIIDARIVNRPIQKENLNACPAGQNTCCYDQDIDLSAFGRTCITPEQATVALAATEQALWKQSCRESVPSSSTEKQCGTRQYSTLQNLQHGQASPGEFPWTCLVLTTSNDFIGSCAIVPHDFNNNNNRGTKKVLTAAHKLKKVQNARDLKIRVGEYDASGFKEGVEAVSHKEYNVATMTNHPEYSRRRLNSDVAVLETVEKIDLSASNVNTACFPSCDTQFEHEFRNGTGTRCWVAGWGKDSATGKFQVVQKKVDLPLVSFDKCNPAIKAALNKRRRGAGDRFTLHPSEICAGGEIGKDACTGDGGSPLVCQSVSGRWTVVGLVTWGVGCADELPGIYARISYFRSWINSL